MKPFLDIKAARSFIESAIRHYEETNVPAWFNEWLDDLYIRLGEDCRKITLDEVITLQSLQYDGCWLMPNYAVNTVYKMFGRLGMSTDGMVSY